MKELPLVTTGVRADVIAADGPVTTTPPLDRTPVTARIIWDDGTLSWARGWTLAYTRRYVHVRVTVRGLEYDVWLAARDVHPRSPGGLS